MAKNKEKESTIGKIIYGFLMFAPLLAILTSCANFIFNKNTNINTNYEETYNITYLQTNHRYHFDNTKQQKIKKQTEQYFIENVENIITETPQTNKGYGYYFDIRIDGKINLSLGETLMYLGFVGSFDFTYTGNETKIETNYITETINYSERNIFYNALDKIEKEKIFNWAKGNDIYTGIKDICKTLSIENTFFPTILTYWLIISTVYFIYDIILIIFHILHNNIHKLEDI